MIYGSLETEPKEIFSAPNTVWNKLCFNTSLRYFRLVLKRLCIVQLNSYQIHFMAHKTPSCDTIMLSKVFDITVLDLMILMHDNPIRYSGHWKGWPWRGGPWKSRLFWAQMALATLVPFKGPKKSRFLGPSPLKCPSLWIVPPQNHFVPPHINNRYIGCFMYQPMPMPMPMYVLCNLPCNI